MNDPDRRHLFDDWARHYDDSVRSGQGCPFDGYDRVLDRILALAAPQPGMDILELGIGTGNLAAHFAGTGVTLWGLDFSDEMLAQAREKLPGAHLARAGRSWDEDEEYWVAGEAIPALEDRGFAVAYEQISSCGGVFVIRGK